MEFDAVTWAALALLLVAAELIGAGGYLLIMGISAATVALIAWAVPSLPWQAQAAIFAVDMLVMALSWKSLSQRLRRAEAKAPGVLNQPAAALVGREFDLHEAIKHGHGKVRVGDTLWLVSGEPLPAGARVRVVGHHGVILEVAACN